MESKTKIIKLFVLLLLCLVFLSNYFSFIDLSCDTVNNFDNFQNLHSSSDPYPEVEWFQKWDYGDLDKGFDVITDLANNIIVVGSTDLGGVGNEDLLMIKYNQSGYPLWNTTWNIRNIDRAYAVTLDSLDNIYVVGKTGVNVNEYDIFLTKFNSEGQHIWTRVWGNADNDYGYDVTLDSDKDIYIVGETNTLTSADMCLIKYDSSGNYLWNRTFGDNLGFDAAYGVCIHNNTDDVYVVGQASMYDSDGDMCLIKYDSSGNELWNTTWGDVNREVGYDVEMYSNNYIYIAGELHSDSLLMKYNLSGDLEWYRTWGDVYEQVARGITVDSEENIYLTGYSGDSGNNDIFMLKYNNTGDKLWDKIWGLSNREEGENIAVDSDFNLFIVGWGTTPYDLLLLKIEQYSPEGFQASHNANEPDTDGAFYLTWNDSVRALTYSVYQYNKPISEINDSLTLLGNNLINNILYISNLETGVWFFKVLAFNLIGNSSSNNVNITVVLPPKISIISPYSNQIFGKEAPNFTVSIIGALLNSSWYSLDGGLNNRTFTNNGSIDQNLWNDQLNGTLTINFYANNSLGNETQEKVKVRKDIFAPNITILSPLTNTLFGTTPPSFVVVVNEMNLHSMWYSLNDGKNCTFTENSTFDSTEWNSLPNGTVHITFYANDTVGNEGSKYIMVIKEIVEETSTAIPGFNFTTVYFLVFAISLLLVFLRRKIKRF